MSTAKYSAVLTSLVLLPVFSQVVFGGAMMYSSSVGDMRNPLSQTSNLAIERLSLAGGTMATTDSAAASTMSNFMVDSFAAVPFERTAAGSVGRMANTISNGNPTLTYQNGYVAAPNGAALAQGINDPGQVTGWFDSRVTVAASTASASQTVFVPAASGTPVASSADLGLNYQGSLSRYQYDGFQYRALAKPAAAPPAAPSGVPEPYSATLCGAGLLALGFLAKRTRSRKNQA